MQMDDFKDVIGATRRDIENWLNRIEAWQSEFAPTRRGVPREYTKENVLELAVVAAFVRVGCRISTAGAFAQMVLRHYRAGQARDWVIVADDDFSKGKVTNDLSNEVVAAVAAMSDRPAVRVVHLAAILEKVEELFASEKATDF